MSNTKFTAYVYKKMTLSRLIEKITDRNVR